MNPRLQKSRSDPSSLSMSKDGYPFDPGDNYWRLNKDVLISIGVATALSSGTQLGFRQALKRYAEEMSAMHTYNMAERMKRFIRNTGASSVTPTALISWRAILGSDEQWQLGGT